MTKRDELLVELDDEFRKGNITFGHLVSEGYHLDGICEGGRVVVDPAPSTVDTLLHELLHRRYTKWSEKRVSKTAERLVRAMSSPEIRRWYRRLNRAAKRAQRPISVD